jgi:pSer/pThr/pTyr-binding forkhead associated (FHA) protein
METFSPTMIAGHDRVAAPVVEVTGPGAGPARVSITGVSAVIGRSADCEIRLDNPLVSRAHARLDLGPDGRWRVRDLGSHNGTRLNNQPAGESMSSARCRKSNPRSWRHRLDAGETLLLFTDGCYELFDASNQMLGPDEFCQLAGAPIAGAAGTAAAADEISRLLDTWQGSAAPSDDRTLLLVRRR